MLNLKGLTIDKIHVDESVNKIRDEELSNINKMVFRFVGKEENQYKVVAAFPHHDRFVFQAANNFDVLGAEDIEKMHWVAGRTARRHWKSLVENTPQRDLS